ncbi:MAG TPA: hypothetical protein VFW78_12610 [Bacteroidia bacterium]|nr:hypothetical protein [Bacteroidia bacterium]
MERVSIKWVLLLYALIAALTIAFFNGTGDAGDSIVHYLFAKYAPVHPELYFDHWAKPLFVLLASPFAQAGFTGIKLFNAVVVLLTLYFTYGCARMLQMQQAIVASVFLLFCPLYYILTFSGLTEPLFALVVTAAIYAVLKERLLLAAILISFLPFIRSEGLLMIGVFALFFLVKRQWKFIPWLITGHLVYSVAGYFVYHDMLWVFNKIPYAGMDKAYGSGTLFHFTEQLLYVTGVPFYILFWAGIVSMVWQIIRNKISTETAILVFIGFMTYLMAHSLFWYFGIFHSIGIKRVLLGVIPLAALIALAGYNFLTTVLLKKQPAIKKAVQGLLIAYVAVFPFTSNKAAVNFKHDMMLTADQQEALRVSKYVMEKYGMEHRFIYSYPYFSETLQLDHFDHSRRIPFSQPLVDHFEKGDVVIWDSWFSVVECGVSKDTLDHSARLVPDRQFNSQAGAGNRTFNIYLGVDGE